MDLRWRRWRHHAQCPEAYAARPSRRLAVRKPKKAVKAVTRMIRLQSRGRRGTTTFTAFPGFRPDGRENCRDGSHDSCRVRVSSDAGSRTSGDERRSAGTANIGFRLPAVTPIGCAERHSMSGLDTN
jgi:hypothetical protein